MIDDHKIKIKVETKEFLELLSHFDKSQIESTGHTAFRFDDPARKLSRLEEIREIILDEEPILVGIQHNRLYAAFYQKNKKVIRIILDIDRSQRKIRIVTFYAIDDGHIPRI